MWCCVQITGPTAGCGKEDEGRAGPIHSLLRLLSYSFIFLLPLLSNHQSLLVFCSRTVDCDSDDTMVLVMPQLWRNLMKIVNKRKVFIIQYLIKFASAKFDIKIQICISYSFLSLRVMYFPFLCLTVYLKPLLI